jgi:hypothetical protein
MRLAAQQDLQQDNVMDRPHIGGERRSAESRGT